MALSKVVYVGDGSTTDFTVNFALGYIARSDIRCRVGAEVDGAGSPAYRPLTFNNDNIVHVGGAVPVNGQYVTFERTVTKSSLISDFSDGNNLTGANLNNAQKQSLMIVHELADGRFSDLSNPMDVNGQRISNGADPIDPTDFATKRWVLNDVIKPLQDDVNGQVGLALEAARTATAKASESASSAADAQAAASSAGQRAGEAAAQASVASTAAGTAAAKASAAEASASTASTKATDAANRAADAAGSASAAAGSASSASTAAATSAQKASDAATAAGNAKTSETNAATSAKAAQDAAASIGPSNTYSKTEIDTKLVGKPNKSGDTYTGRHFIPLGAQFVPNDDLTVRIEGGSWQTGAATTAKGWPETTNGYYHLLSSTHDNPANYHALQIAGGFGDNDKFFVRKTTGNGAQPWRKLWHDGNDLDLGKKINFRQKKFVLSEYGLVDADPSTTAMSQNAYAWAQVVNDIKAAPYGGTIIIPSGRCYMNTPVGSDTFPASVSYEGAGYGAELYFMGLNNTNALAIGTDNNACRVSLKNLKIYGRNTTNMSSFIYMKGGGGLQSINVDSVDVNCDTTSIASNYILILNPNYSTIRNLNLDAQQGAYGSSGNGLYMRGDKQSTDVKLDAVTINRVGTAFMTVMSQNNGQYGIEGVSYSDCIVVGSQIGLFMQGGWYSAPGHGWRGGHMNVQSYGIVLKQCSQFKVDSTLLYMDINGSPTAFYYAENGIDLHVIGSSFCYVDQLGTGKAFPNVPGVVAGTGVQGLTVGLCHFSGFPTAAPAVRNTAGTSVRAMGLFKPSGGTVLDGSIANLGGNA